MVKLIAVYNTKGGVGKTTTAANIGTAFANIGKRVILVDADPQTNLTSFFAANNYGMHEPQAFKIDRLLEKVSMNDEATKSHVVEDFMDDEDNEPKKGDVCFTIDDKFVSELNFRTSNYNSNDDDYEEEEKKEEEKQPKEEKSDTYQTLISALPYFGGYSHSSSYWKGKVVKLAKIFHNLLLMPGTPNIVVIENELEKQDPESVFFGHRLYGIFRKFFLKLATDHNADYIIIDLSASQGLFNRTIVMSCDFIIPPVAADKFSLVSSKLFLSKVLPNWYKWTSHINKTQEIEGYFNDELDKSFKFKMGGPKILPFILLSYNNNIKNNEDEWLRYEMSKISSMIDKLPENIRAKMISFEKNENSCTNVVPISIDLAFFFSFAEDDTEHYCRHVENVVSLTDNE